MAVSAGTAECRTFRERARLDYRALGMGCTGADASSPRRHAVGKSPVMARFPHSVALVVARGTLGVLIVSLGLAACSGSRAYSGNCQVPPVHALPHRVEVGGTVVLYAGPFNCHPFFSGPQTLQVTVDQIYPSNEGRTANVAAVRVGRSGAFRIQARIPPYFRPGDGAFFTVTGPLLDQRWCPQGNGTIADCSPDGVGVLIARSRAP
jgi:hypothetical protein